MRNTPRRLHVTIEAPTDVPEGEPVEYRAAFEHEGWHDVEIRFVVEPGVPPRCTSVQVLSSPDSTITAEDLREVSLPKLLETALWLVTPDGGEPPPKRQRLEMNAETLATVAKVWHQAQGHKATAVKAIVEGTGAAASIQRSRPQAYRLLDRAESAGYLTTHEKEIEK